MLREAIKVLAAKGLVEARPKTGTRVSPRHRWNLLDPDVLAWQQDGSSPVAFLSKLTEVRLIIEPAAAELAARRANAREIEAIEGAYREMEASLRNGTEDYEAFDRADIVFHQRDRAGVRERSPAADGAGRLLGSAPSASTPRAAFPAAPRRRSQSIAPS